MAALPLNTAPHFVFYYRFCNSLDFYCTLHPKKQFLSFSRTFCDYQGDFFEIQGQFKDNCTFLKFQEFSRTKVIFKVCANPIGEVDGRNVLSDLPHPHLAPLLVPLPVYPHLQPPNVYVSSSVRSPHNSLLGPAVSHSQYHKPFFADASSAWLHHSPGHLMLLAMNRKYCFILYFTEASQQVIKGSSINQTTTS